MTDETPRLTYREKRLRKAERLREWSGKREEASTAAYEQSSRLADQIPFGQPVLVGHYSEKRHRRHIARIDSAMGKSVENSRKAEEMASRAANIEAAVDNAIYSDDPDAIERLEKKLAAMEAQRETIKAENAAFRKEHREQLKGRTAYEKDSVLPHRSYELTNLGGNITRTRKRLEQLRREKERGPLDRVITARRDGACEDCGAALSRGELIRYSRQQGARCMECER